VKRLIWSLSVVLLLLPGVTGNCDRSGTFQPWLKSQRNHSLIVCRGYSESPLDSLDESLTAEVTRSQ
jgi:hypothetical protein